ncbi:DUF1194 domain-containing protein [Cognatiyoonia sp. IB215182]|uniref:DUF1194 domain-containing protein n=1 Tax=Cognatiyoonia sp. IB215182 TaxID=3097353 RepID=UPI002A125CF3|nr:DUF1194 domain-containing protein [Cognatiyoonia sp. IB215182]MDX8354385.1 DUF1194 domain-containing protein [Cognatiyoonia sp. IB215182]
MIRALACLLIWSGAAHAACRQALALGLDMSTSVDAVEYRLQLEGLASALQSDAVQEVLFAQPDAPIRIAVFEWSGPPNQTLVLPWTELQTPADLADAVRTIRGHQRITAAPTTAIGAALLYGFALLDAQPDCWKRTLDLSGDGETNTGPRPEDIPSDRTPPGVTVNGLVIGSGNARGDDHRFADIKALSAYYRRNVVRGPGAFVEVALGFEDYAAAMERKLLRELASIAIGQLGDVAAFR